MDIQEMLPQIVDHSIKNALQNTSTSTRQNISNILLSVGNLSIVIFPLLKAISNNTVTLDINMNPYEEIMT